MEQFEHYISSKEVKNIPSDLVLARNLLKDARERFNTFFPYRKPTKFIFENGYEAIRELIDSILALDGYESSSPEAPVTFLLKMNKITEKEADTLEYFRQLQNQSKFSGKQFEEKELQKILPQIREIYEKIRKIVEARVI